MGYLFDHWFFGYWSFDYLVSSVEQALVLIFSYLSDNQQHLWHYCADFPDSNESEILPQLMLSKYPEKKDPVTGDVLVSKQLEGTNPVIGLQSNARGK